MRWRFGLTLLAALLVSLALTAPVGAASLRLRPLLYEGQLQAGEKRQGFIDVSNPTSQTLQLSASVQAFRQIDNSGSLEFYDDPRVKAGLVPDLKSFELGPGQAMRLYFVLDGTKLPSGDVFAALFVASKPDAKAAASTSIRLGTLFTIVNGTPGARQAAVTDINVPFFQFGDSVKGSYQITNTADPESSSGYYPQVSISLNPFETNKSQRSPLVFAGRSRTVSFDLPTSRLGFYRLSVGHEDSSQWRWVFVATGIWPAVLAGAVVLAVIGLVLWRQIRSRRGRPSGLRIRR